MTEEETKRFMFWFRAAVESAVKDVADCRKDHGEWANGFYRGCVVTELAGLRRMIRSAFLDSETRVDCWQAVRGLESLLASIPINL